MTALELWPYYTQEILTEGPTYEPDLWVVRGKENEKRKLINRDIRIVGRAKSAEKIMG